MPELEWPEVILRVALAGALGGAIGFERELRDREAGFRTHMLVAVGAALFTLVSAYGFRDFDYGFRTGINLDPTRIAAQIVTGIGFLGAGAIIRQGLSVRGLTTAATLWVVAAIGLAAGAGYYSAAVVSTALVLIALWPLRMAAHRVVQRLRPEEGRLVVDLPPGHSAAPLLAKLEQLNVRVHGLEIEDEEDRRFVSVQAEFREAARTGEVIDEVTQMEEVRRVEWHT
ncbi:MAG: MgtC/SapB family protein [Thermoleophilia bacterium]|nr:MgtC/SapB family protein [Thermoleophilia bacterium]